MMIRRLLTSTALVVSLMLSLCHTAPAQDETDPAPAETPADAPAEKAEEAPATPKPDPVADFLWVDTVPSGAEVSLNGRKLGTTPSMIQKLDDGDHELTFTLRGYETLKQTLKVPNDGKQSVIKLQQKKGSCVIESKPSNATVVLGPRLLGRTPIVLDANEISPGEYLARVMKTGYVSKKVSITIEEDQPSRQIVELENDFGEIEVTSTPAGANLFVNGVDMGTSKTANETTRKSTPRIFKGLVSGKHKVHLVYGGEPGITSAVKVEAGESVKVNVMIWYPDFEIQTITEKTLHAMVIESLANGDLVIATNPTKVFTLKKSDIKYKNAIPPAEGKRLVQKERIRRKMREQEERAKKLR